MACGPCTRSSRFGDSETIPFPGADSIFSSGCGAISGRLRLAAIPTTEGSTIGSAIRAGTAAPAERLATGSTDVLEAELAMDAAGAKGVWAEWDMLVPLIPKND